MFTTEFSEAKKIWIDLYQQINYWKAQHTKSIERERVLKAKVQELTTTICSQNVQIKDLSQQFDKTIHGQNIQIEKLNRQIEELNALNVWLKQRVFGRQTEQSKDLEKNNTYRNDSSSSFANTSKEKRPRGQQKGSPGHGRKHRKNLPSIEISHDLKEHEKYCPICGLPFNLFPTTQDSEDIDYEIRLVRRIHKRKCYSPTCHCGVVPGIVAAPPPDKLIPKGMFSVDFWVHILAEKFLSQRPMSRILQSLALEGLNISQGTITGGLEKIKDMVYPLYTRILEKSRTANHWHMDETRWMMFVTIDDKIGYRWWLWVVVTQDTAVYILDPSRSAKVPKNHLGENPKGTINADRYSSYKALASESLLIAYCWVHVRRDYYRIYNSCEQLRPWAEMWFKDINNIFHLNNKRLEVLSDPDKFYITDQALRHALDSMKQSYEKELKCIDLHPVKHKALNSLREHWDGLLIFVDNPEVPMDNNLSERQLREAVLGRKNYYGCGSIWSGNLTASMFTIFQTARLNHIHPKKFLKTYLEACAKNHGQTPENIDDFLPWNLSEEQKLVLKYPEHPP